MKYATLLVSVLIIIAVLMPGSNLPDVNIGGFDKLIHFGMFAVWAIAVRFDFGTKLFPWILVIVTGLLFSGLTEVLQLVVEGRSFDFYDMAADALGLMAGLAVSGPVVRQLKKVTQKNNAGPTRPQE